MKFQPESPAGAVVVTRSEDGVIWLGATRHERSVIVAWSGTVLEWPVATFDELAAHHFEQVAALQPEVVIFGSGARLRFPRPQWLRPLVDRGIGVETMDTAAACRTYNVLVGERRAVVGALLLGGP